MRVLRLTGDCVVCRYFAELSVELLDDLMEIYGPDFKLFGYDATAYYDVVRRAAGNGTKKTTEEIL